MSNKTIEQVQHLITVWTARAEKYEDANTAYGKEQYELAVNALHHWQAQDIEEVHCDDFIEFGEGDNLFNTMDHRLASIVANSSEYLINQAENEEFIF